MGSEMCIRDRWNGGAASVDDLVSLGRKARMQLTQAVASLIVHEVGLELRDRATKPGGAGLEELVNGLAVGVVRQRGKQR